MSIINKKTLILANPKNTPYIIYFMNTTKESLRNAVQTMLNDVMERGYKHMINYPQENDALNRLVNQANKTMHEFLDKIAAFPQEKDEIKFNEFYQEITIELDQKSLEYLSRLQEIQRKAIKKREEGI